MLVYNLLYTPLQAMENNTPLSYEQLELKILNRQLRTKKLEDAHCDFLNINPYIKYNKHGELNIDMLDELLNRRGEFPHMLILDGPARAEGDNPLELYSHLLPEPLPINIFSQTRVISSLLFQLLNAYYNEKDKYQKAYLCKALRMFVKYQYLVYTQAEFPILLNAERFCDAAHLLMYSNIPVGLEMYEAIRQANRQLRVESSPAKIAAAKIDIGLLPQKISQAQLQVDIIQMIIDIFYCDKQLEISDIPHEMVRANNIEQICNDEQNSRFDHFLETNFAPWTRYSSMPLTSKHNNIIHIDQYNEREGHLEIYSLDIMQLINRVLLKKYPIAFYDLLNAYDHELNLEKKEDLKKAVCMFVKCKKEQFKSSDLRYSIYQPKPKPKHFCDEFNRGLNKAMYKEVNNYNKKLQKAEERSDIFEAQCNVNMLRTIIDIYYNNTSDDEVIFDVNCENRDIFHKAYSTKKKEIIDKK